MPQPGTGLTSGQIRITIGLGWLVALLEGYDLQVISSAGPQLRAAMHLNPEQIGLFFSASLIGLAVGSVGGGILADRIGRKAVLVGSVLVMGLFALLASQATNFPLLFALRVGGGVGLGGAMPTLIALISEVTGGMRTTSSVTTMICGQPAGGIISALVGHTLAEWFGWQSLFLVGGALTVLTVPLMLRWMPETGMRRAAHSFGNTATISARATLFGGNRAGGTPLLWALFILTLAILSITLSWTPLLVLGKGLPIPVALNTIIAINVGGIVGGLVTSRLVDRFGVAMPMVALYIITALAFWQLSLAETAPLLLGAGFFVGVGVLGAQFSLYGIAPRLYPPAGRGLGVGLAVAMGRIGAVLGPLLIGRMLGMGAGSAHAIMVLVPVALIAGLVLLGLAAFVRDLARAGGAPGKPLAS